MNQIKNRRLQKEIENRISFRRSLSNLETGERNLVKAAQIQKKNAVDAEKNGDHAAAVRFALEAQRLEKQVRVAGDMKNTTLTVHAMAGNTRALTGMMKNVNKIANSSGMPDPAEMIGMQVQMEIIRENMDMMMETSGATFDQMTETAGLPEQETGETLLRELMKNEERRERRNVLVETGKKLDARNRFRVTE